jgi:Permuted papain-like amidase enzyme, YaeF/YiiX, C92 family
MDSDNELPRPHDRPTLIPIADLRPGDILLEFGTDDLPVKVQKATNHTYTHAAIYLGGNQIAEAVVPKVRRAEFAIPHEGHIAVIRSQFEFDSRLEERLNAFVDAAIAKKISYNREVLRSGWVEQIKRRRQDYADNALEKLKEHFDAPLVESDPFSHRYTCSQFVARCYYAVGLLGQGMTATTARPDLLLPEDLGSNDFFFGHIVGYVAREGYKIPADDPFRDRATHASQGFY